jgi:hypothetical protein
MMTANIALRLEPALLRRIDELTERERGRRQGQNWRRADLIRQCLIMGVERIERWEREQKSAGKAASP